MPERSRIEAELRVGNKGYGQRCHINHKEGTYLESEDGNQEEI